MNLIIDQGNTNLKLYFFEQNKIIKKIIYPLNNISDFFSEKIENVIYSTVSGQEILEKYIKKFEKIIHFSINTPIPIKNKYLSDTLGVDRLAAAVGAFYLFVNKNVLIIDIGTAITYDILTENGEFLGGNISPGLNLRFRALNNYTKNLPLLEYSENNMLFANNTKDAIICGVQNGILFEIEGYIMQTQKNYDNLTIIFTGGDLKLFENKLNFNIFAEPNLVAYGLNCVLNYNVLTKK